MLNTQWSTNEISQEFCWNNWSTCSSFMWSCQRCPLPHDKFLRDKPPYLQHQSRMSTSSCFCYVKFWQPSWNLGQGKKTKPEHFESPYSYNHIRMSQYLDNHDFPALFGAIHRHHLVSVNAGGGLGVESLNHRSAAQAVHCMSNCSIPSLNLGLWFWS